MQMINCSSHKRIAQAHFGNDSPEPKSCRQAFMNKFIKKFLIWWYDGDGISSLSTANSNFKFCVTITLRRKFRSVQNLPLTDFYPSQAVGFTASSEFPYLHMIITVQSNVILGEISKLLSAGLIAFFNSSGLSCLFACAYHNRKIF